MDRTTAPGTGGLRGARRRSLNVAVCVALGATALLAGPASGEDEPPQRRTVQSCLVTIRTSDDPVARFAAVRDLGAIDSPSVPSRLAELATTDADPGLRLEAVHALCMTPNPAADDVLLDLIAAGGPREVREAVATVARDRGIRVGTIVRRIEAPEADVQDRSRLVESLAAWPDMLTAGELDRIARLWRGPTRDAAFRALLRHPKGALVAPDLVADLLASSDDIDTLVSALEAAEAYGDDRVDAQADRLRALGLPLVDAALDVALAHVAERRALRGGGAPTKPARVRDRVDTVFVAHQGRDLQRVWSAVLATVAASNPRWEDLRIGCELYMEPTSMQPRRTHNRLSPTRDPAKVDEFFSKLVFQTKRGNGSGLAETLESAFDRTSWRWDAKRTVVLYADAGPRSSRAAVPPAIHRVMDGTELRVFFFGRDTDDVPDGLKNVADAGGSGVTVVDPADKTGSKVPGVTSDPGSPDPATTGGVGSEPPPTGTTPRPGVHDSPTKR